MIDRAVLFITDAQGNLKTFNMEGEYLKRMADLAMIAFEAKGFDGEPLFLHDDTDLRAIELAKFIKGQ
jgi:hypothetical protein